MTTDERTSKIIEKAQRICRAVAQGSLLGWPLYIVDASELPEDCRAKADAYPCFGQTAPWLSEALREFLGDRWEGIGPAILLDFEAMNGFITDPAAFEGQVASVALHELAHVFEGNHFRYFDEPPPEHHTKPDWGRGFLKAAVEKHETPPPASGDPGHDMEFVRAVIWICERANDFQKEFWFTPSVVAGRHVPFAYTPTLRDEMEEMYDWPLSEAIRQTPPMRFVKLWNREQTESESRHVAADQVLPGINVKGIEMGVVTSVIDRLLSKKRASEETAITRYNEIVSVFVRDKAPDDETIEAVLQASGRTLEELANDVALSKKRAIWAAAVEAGDEAQKTLEELENQATQLRAQLEADHIALNIEFETTMGPVIEQADAARSTAAVAVKAADNLRRTAEPSRQQVVSERRKTASLLRQELTVLQTKKGQAESAINIVRNNTQSKFENVCAEAAARLPIASKALADIMEAMTSKQAEIEAAERQAEQDEKLLLVP